jgi:hypothetical protein
LGLETLTTGNASFAAAPIAVNTDTGIDPTIISAANIKHNIFFFI